MPATRILAGAMSGTSADGVDIAVCEVTGRGLDMTVKLLHHHARPYDADLRGRIFAIRGSGRTSLADLAKLGRDVSLAYAEAVRGALREANLRAGDLSAIAAHGQTLFHGPPDTIQWFDPSLVAAETGCAVVSDFRRADLAAGGQGAPLVPFADYILFRHPTKSRVLLNIGGIANLTWLPAGCGPNDLIAFDTGPGNCISDYLCQTMDPAGPGYDVGGKRASESAPQDRRAIVHFTRNDYFQRPPPKSTDGPEMIRYFQDAMGKVTRDPGPNPTLNRLLASAALMTSVTIGRAIASLGTRPDELIVSGGGVHNLAIMRPLKLVMQTQRTAVLASDEVGVSSSAKEALAFALLGAATLDGEPSNVPSVTGARRAVVLGSITPKPF